LVPAHDCAARAALQPLTTPLRERVTSGTADRDSRLYPHLVKSVDEWPAAPVLTTERLDLEPLRVDHADEMAPLLDDPQLYVFTGGRPWTLEELRERYEHHMTARSDDGSQRWLNWIARLRDSGEAVGGLQATVTAVAVGFACELAWIVALRHQGRGYAREGATAMATWLREQGASLLIADIHPGHEASMAVARALGLDRTGEVVDGEIRWTDRGRRPPR
jgi:RimJ/RimL family protein N-acetyltransferase